MAKTSINRVVIGDDWVRRRWWAMPRFKTTAEVLKIIGNKSQIRKA